MNTTSAVVKIGPEKNSGLYGIWTHDLCDTGIVKVLGSNPVLGMQTLHFIRAPPEIPSNKTQLLRLLFFKFLVVDPLVTRSCSC